MNKATIAKAISVIFHPIGVLTIMPFFLVYKISNDFMSAFWWMLYSALFLFAIGGFIFYGVKRKMFNNFDVSNQTNRPVLFIACGVVSVTYLIGLMSLHAPIILLISIFGMVFAITVLSIINIWIKASIHVATISAFLFALAILYEGSFLLLLLGVPLVAWSRLQTRRHTLPEVVIGGVMGSLLSLVMYGVLKVFIYH